MESPFLFVVLAHTLVIGAIAVFFFRLDYFEKKNDAHSKEWVIGVLEQNKAAYAYLAASYAGRAAAVGVAISKLRARGY
jgi:hypothetical protein